MHSTRPLSQFATELRDWLRRALEPGAPPLPFAELALRLFALQFEHNAPYRRWCEARGATPERVKDWRQIPAVPAASFKELELTCLPIDERVAEFHSSGTTARIASGTGVSPVRTENHRRDAYATKPSRHLHSHESLALYEASLTAWFRPHLLPGWPAVERRASVPLAASDVPARRAGRSPYVESGPADFTHFLALSPSPALAPHSSLAHMFATVQREFGHGPAQFFGGLDATGAWTLDTEAVAVRLRAACASDQPVILLGTAFSFVHLLDALAERDESFALPAGSRVMETGGYKGRSRELPKAELHRLINTLLGVPTGDIVCEYGMSELSSQAYASCGSPISTFQFPLFNFHFPPWCRTVVISPETGAEVPDGSPGLLRVLDLANVWSVMVIQTEDLAIRRGDGFELLGRATTAEPRGCSLMATA
jgi:hypothetical protein